MQFLDQVAHTGLGRGRDGDHDPIDERHDAVANEGAGVAQDGHAANGLGRAALAIVEDAQDGHVAAFERPFDQPFSVFGRPHDDDVRDQPPRPAKPAYAGPPPDVEQLGADEGDAEPDGKGVQGLG